MFAQILESLALALESAKIPYMLIGGQAVLLYGEPRLTQDIDVTLGIGPESLPHLLAVIERLGWQVLVDDAPGFVSKTLILPCSLPESSVRVDFIFSFSPYERQAISRARQVAIGKAKVAFVSVEDLLIHKIVAARPRDLEDARIVLAKNPDIDLAYVRDWLGQFDQALAGSYGDCLEEMLREGKDARQIPPQV